MKKILIAATAVGAAAAGLILYYRRKANNNVSTPRIADAASSAYKTENNEADRAQRPPQHAMG